MRVLITGDRNWKDAYAIAQYIDTLPVGTVIIHGDASGADRIAGHYAKERGLEVDVYPAEWDLYGRGAGPIRNKQMLVEGQPDKVVYFHKNLELSKGTRNMVMQATEAGFEVINGWSLAGEPPELTEW